MYNVYNIVWNLTENQFGTRTMCKHVALYLHITWYAEALLTRNLMKNVLYVKSVLNFISWVFVKICWMNFFWKLNDFFFLWILLSFAKESVSRYLRWWQMCYIKCSNEFMEFYGHISSQKLFKWFSAHFHTKIEK